jgi:transposase-like protein
VIYTTNAIESLNSVTRKSAKTRKLFVFYRSGSRFLDYHDLRKIEEKKKIEDMKIENNEACK